MTAGVVFFGLNCAESQFNRSSGSLAMPTWPRWLAAGSGLTLVSQRKTVLLPEPAKPTMPTFMKPIHRVTGGDQELPSAYTLRPAETLGHAGRKAAIPIATPASPTVMKLSSKLKRCQEANAALAASRHARACRVSF